MALRLLEVIVPEQNFNDVTELLKQNEISNFWQTCSCESKIIFKIILQVEKTEGLIDQFESRYKHLESFRLILFPLEASYPSPKQIEKKSEESLADGSQKAPLRVSRQELYNDIFDSSKLTNVFLIMVFLSTVVAAVGLLRDNTAIIIGAMVIAPLLGPNVAMSLATTLGDYELGASSIKTNLSGITLSFVISLVLGFFLNIDPDQPEILSRTIVGYGDIILALASGIAGALAFTSGVSATLIGVMVAVALIPPLVVSGLLLGSGFVYKSLDAILLLTINMICINVSGTLVFVLQGIRPISWWEAAKAKKATRVAISVWTLLLLILIFLLYYKIERNV
jgi:uncharacterized hydrophobic protein (TIGR00341 family)